jgi:hypothetical protein
VSIWDEVDDPVLRWLLAQEADPQWTGMLRDLPLRPKPEPQPAFDGDLDSLQVDDALTRLRDHGLIAAERGETTHYAIWSQLRVKADGLIILGEWPDLDRVTSTQGVVVLLTELAAETTSSDDKKSLRKAAGAIGRLGEGIVDSALESLGGELAG